ncbi:hypothetical protein ACW5WQ_07940 [Aeromonas rivuli]|jgi:hypothetical protein|uniref:hypothetical protein n=1 Tax=Aeromonas rivuli TaxID=648794 RepID=UPI0005A61E03|nr:hypothetical protein [Aeromonas rivuli]
MTYQYKGVCYGDPDSLLAAMASDMSGVSIGENGQPVYYQTAVQGEQLITSSTAGFSVTVTPQLYECQLVTIQDAAIYNGGVILMWVTAFVYVALARSASAGN